MDFTSVVVDTEESPAPVVTWWQTRPGLTIPSGKEAMLQICFSTAPRRPLRLLLSKEGSRPCIVHVEPPASRSARITGLRLSRGGDALMVSYEASGGTKPAHLLLAGKVPLNAPEILCLPRDGRPGVLRQPLGEPATPGGVMDVELRLADGSTDRVMSRPSNRISLMAFHLQGVVPREITTFHLDQSPVLHLDESDPVCSDHVKGRSGDAAAALIAARQQTWKSRPEQPFGFYLCVPSQVAQEYQLYGRLGDVTAINPYRRAYGSHWNFIAQEERLFHHASRITAPGRWLYIAEAFTSDNEMRFLEPAEIRLLAFMAMGHGALGVHYFLHSDTGSLRGFSGNKALRGEILRLNKDLRSLEPLLASALPCGVSEVDTDSYHVRFYHLMTEKGEPLVIAVNLDYVTDCGSNVEKKAHFRHAPAKNVVFEMEIPEGWKENEANGPFKAAAVDVLTLERINADLSADRRSLKLYAQEINLVRVLLLKPLSSPVPQGAP